MSNYYLVAKHSPSSSRRAATRTGWQTCLRWSTSSANLASTYLFRSFGIRETPSCDGHKLCPWGSQGKLTQLHNFLSEFCLRIVRGNPASFPSADMALSRRSPKDLSTLVQLDVWQCHCPKSASCSRPNHERYIMRTQGNLQKLNRKPFASTHYLASSDDVLEGQHSDSLILTRPNMPDKTDILKRTLNW